ncbi:MAG TPA: hypothetical protein VFA18_23340, partial [Gemmataceae bacterium]|nr:hypothetical protein [Gemmataceae bacterium]
MRRKRHQLQVSTFPFLAVLLCAMGSLILLLLVIDRRAKEAAREKALRAYRQSTAEEERLAAARKAELERQSQELHARLLHANESVLAQVHATEDDLRAALRRLDDARRKYQEAQTRMRTATDQLKQDQSQLGQEQGAVLRATQAAEANRKELARLAAELRELEQTVIDLKLARQRQGQTYSLMPYRGRQGDNRQPLYIECSALGYIFHPDRLVIRLSQVRLADIRTEVEHRLARLREMAQGEVKKPYVLLLVRPDGIESYYVLMSALDGLGLDFGYEFVERDWVLDFQNEGVLGNQPWMAEATPAAPARSDLKPLDLRRRNHASLTGAYTFGATGSG